MIGSIAIASVVAAVARKVITPPSRRTEDLTIFSSTATTVTLSSTLDTRLAGQYSLWFHGGDGHARVGEVISSTATTVTRSIVKIDFGDLATATRGRFGSWVYLSPADLPLPFTDVTIDTPLGAAPAWLIEAKQPTTSWVIGVHGRGVQRAESLRAVEVFRDAGYTNLLVSYRNDGEAPASLDGLYALGDTEWEDVDAAVRYAHTHGATDVVLLGWSMGGATVLQTATRSAHAHLIRGMVLESPVVDWVTALRHQGRSFGLANPFRHGVFRLISASWGGRITGQSAPIDLQRLDFVRRAAELTIPILILHSADDTFVPATASRELALRRPDIVEYDEFTLATHTRLWNYDPDRWTARIAQWLRALSPPTERTDSPVRRPEAESS
jgi:alpha-beta hydrolase superfamily lysophospholipase